MSTSLPYHSIGVRSYDNIDTKFKEGAEIITIKQDQMNSRCAHRFVYSLDPAGYTTKIGDVREILTTGHEIENEYNHASQSSYRRTRCGSAYYRGIVLGLGSSHSN